MSRNNVSLRENEDLKLFMGRTLTLLGQLDAKLNSILSFQGIEEEATYDNVEPEGHSEQWEDG